MKKRWFLVPILAGVLAISITGGVALAQDDGTGIGSPWSKIASKVAVILGLEEADVQAALDQAAREIQDEALQQKLDCMVEEGRLTPEQADEYGQWSQSRPEGIAPFGGFGGRGFHRGGMMGGSGGRGMWFHFGSPPAPTPDDSGATSF